MMVIEQVYNRSRMLIYYLIINIIAFLLYGMDKWKAKLGAWRIPEKTLLGVALLGGGLGALLGIQLFRHKTRHLSFRILVPLFLILHIVIISLLEFV